MRNLVFIFISVVFISCSKDESGDVTGSAVMLCTDDKYKEICDLTHDGALCSLPRANTIRALVNHYRNSTVKNSYIALTVLDTYKACLENVVIAQSSIQKSDEISRFRTIANIPKLQDKIAKETRGVRPEINLWLYKKTGNPDYWESMLNGVAMTDTIHHDVYTVMLAEAATRSIDEAKKIADLLVSRTELLNDLTPEIFEFYILFYLKNRDNFKAAVWHGLYTEYIKENPGINVKYFKFHGKMQSATLNKAQKLVDSIIFDANWKGLKVKDLEKVII
ncbi:DUF2989 domain-containing protein [uncultured Paraglaciecola sp.]|uniref:DUF2989 domain-containing protein n=1 Tax=uncultured Paraglaciecola sp. TaxID=1765024 RepID=UPI0030D7BB1A|tara:strand:- start:9706 stop:10539 length:834 start_codon:yes stop_codon:yes gene_type:complete